MRYKAIDILNLKVVEIVLIMGLLISSVAFLIDIVAMSSFAVMIGSGSIVLTLLLLLIYKKRWIGNNVTTTALTAFFCFTFFPYQWLLSKGATGVMPYYSFLLILLCTIILNGKWAYWIPIGIIFESISFYYLEMLYPNVFINLPDIKADLFNLTLHYTAVSTIILVAIYKVKVHYLGIQKTFYELSIMDDLTNVYNRRKILDSLLEVSNYSNRQQVDFVVLFIDINGFKGINDQEGHHIGDLVLIELGRVLLRNLRNYDIGGRYGGDEFVVILPHTDLLACYIVAQRISEDFIHSIKEITNVPATLAIGSTNGKDKTCEEIIREADQHMYHKKLIMFNQSEES